MGDRNQKRDAGPEGEPDEDPLRSLPPLPDGGLATAMPAWLRAPLLTTLGAPETFQASVGKEPADTNTTPSERPSWISQDDLPAWVRSLAEPALAGPRSASDSDDPRRRTVTVEDVFARYGGRRPVPDELIAEKEDPGIDPPGGSEGLAPFAMTTTVVAREPVSVAMHDAESSRRVFALVGVVLVVLLILVVVISLTS